MGSTAPILDLKRELGCTSLPASALLIVMPGAHHREPVLRRIVSEVGPVVVMVPSFFAQVSAWAKPIASDWIEWHSDDDWKSSAWAALTAWMKINNVKLTSCMTYDDWGVELCAWLSAAERLNAPCTDFLVVRSIRDKVNFRQLCAAQGVPGPKFARLCTTEDLEQVLTETWSFPVVLKPACGAGSLYMCKAHSEAELREAFSDLSSRAAHEKKMPPDDLAAGFALEEFFEGSEVDVDGWALHGTVGWLSVADNKPAIGSSFCEAGGIYPSQLPPHLIEKLEQLTRDVVKAVGGLHSCFHFEALVNPTTGKVMPIELNCRVGGAECPVCVEAVTGRYLPVDAAYIALGQCPPAPEQTRCTVAASVNLHASHYGVVRACCATEELELEPSLLGTSFYARQGMIYTPGNGSSSALGWLAACGDSVEEAEANLNRCVALCRLEVDPMPDHA